jgi:hypothetical protein
MPKILGSVQVVGGLTATTVNGITGLSSTSGDIQPNGTQSAGISTYAARVDHVHEGSGGSQDATVNTRLDLIEFSIALFKNNNYYKEFVYSGESLTGYNIYEDLTKVVHLMEVVLGYTGENLTTKTITRTSDNKTITITFEYSGDNLISQTVTTI